jgi:hypothetical protein
VNPSIEITLAWAKVRPLLSTLPVKLTQEIETLDSHFYFLKKAAAPMEQKLVFETTKISEKSNHWIGNFFKKLVSKVRGN